MPSSTRMDVKFAHRTTQGVSFVVFAADAPSRTAADRTTLLAELTARARTAGLQIDKAALAYRVGKRVEYFGAQDLVRFLATGKTPQLDQRLRFA